MKSGDLTQVYAARIQFSSLEEQTSKIFFSLKAILLPLSNTVKSSRCNFNIIIEIDEQVDAEVKFRLWVTMCNLGNGA